MKKLKKIYNYLKMRSNSLDFLEEEESTRQATNDFVKEYEKGNFEKCVILYNIIKEL